MILLQSQLGGIEERNIHRITTRPVKNGSVFFVPCKKKLSLCPV